MATYELRYTGAGKGGPQRIRFEADDASTALIVAHREASDRSAELWRDDQRVCTIDRRPVAPSEFVTVEG